MTIHTALVAKQSPALKALVSGSMEEAKTRTVIWREVDEETFGLFAHFAYTGDYLPPSHTIEKRARKKKSKTTFDWEETTVSEEPIADHSVQESLLPAPVVLEVRPADDAEPEPTSHSTFGAASFGWGSETTRKKKVKKQKLPRVKFQDLQYATTSAFPLTIPRANASDKENYTPVFLGHARLYAFAEKWDIAPLRALVLHKLHGTLVPFTPYEERCGDVVELARYVYANTPTRTQMDPLREMMVQYIAYEAKQVADSKACMDLVSEGGDFASELLAMVLERVT